MEIKCIHGDMVSLWILLFALYSLLGWIIEVLYRSFTQGKFVNAGLIHGPFLPLYGFGALSAALLYRWLPGIHILLLLLVALFFVFSTLEYTTGWVCERLFRLRLWDYSDNRVNLHGRICLSFSTIWALMGVIFLLAVHPVSYALLARLPRAVEWGVASFYVVYLAIDFWFSVKILVGFRRRLGYLLEQYLTTGRKEMDRIWSGTRRLRNAFPLLRTYLNNSISDNLKSRVGDLMASSLKRARLSIEARKPLEQEYTEIVADILENTEFQRLREFFHHNSSIYQHALSVSFTSYKVCKRLKLDYRSAARGGLLHDFFLYDWRDHDEPDLAKEKFHGLHHPRIALENSLKHFTLNRTERDIIVKHMWPLTLRPPITRESFIVSFVDKYASSREFLQEWGKKIKARAKAKRNKKRKNPTL
ncbi:hypothetical protein KKF84_22335 [Myxococcota bacterium]|nr:hypothetical protein [Myxococcota bacterium]